MKTLRDALLDHSPQMLRAIAEMNQLELPEGGTREQWASHLASALARDEHVRHVWETFASGEREALQKILAGGGRVKAFQMLRDHGEIRAFGPVALARDKPWLAPQNASERLWYLGFIQRAFDVVSDFRGEIFYVPDEIAAHLPQPVVESVRFAVEKAPPPSGTRDHGDSLMWDMFILLAYVAREEPRYVEGTLLGSDDLRRVEAQLIVKEERAVKDIAHAPRLSFLVRLARTARLMRPHKEGSLRLGSEARNWLRDTHQNRRLQLFDAWRRERVWNELKFVPSLKVEETGWRNDPRLSREAVLKFLALCSRSEWIALPTFISSIKKADPDFQRPDGDYDRWHIRHAETGKLLTGFSNWNQVEGAQLNFIFAGPLLWLGIVKLDGEGESPAAFQLTEFGARALGLSDKDLFEARPLRFIVQADLDVLVPLEAPFFARFQLERMAERVQWDRISTYHLSRESLTRMLRRQVSIDQVLAFLKRVSREPFPKNVEYSLREWAAKYGEITIKRAAVLHTRNMSLLVELQHHPELKSYILEVLSPTVALVEPERIEELQARLEVLGYSPKVEVVG